MKAVLRIRAFRRLWAVLGLSSLGDWLGLLATWAFASDQVSGSAAKGMAAALVIVVRLLPALVMGPLAGVFADRFDRRYTMVVCDLVRFALFASIPAAALVTDRAAVVVGWAAVATFFIETASLLWIPAKEAAVPNLLPRARLETANQLSLATTYGVTPVAAALLLAGLTTGMNAVIPKHLLEVVRPADVPLYFNALTFLATALTVLFCIKEISGRSGTARERKPSVLRDFVNGWSFVSRTPLVRGLVLGILGAFAGGGVVIGTAQFYAKSLGGGDSTFYVLFAMLFIGLSVGVVAGPRMIGALSRRRWFGISIILAAASVAALSLAWHLSLAVLFTLFVGLGAGMAFLSGTTLLGGEVDDELRGRSFAFVQAGTRVVLMLTTALSALIVGAGGSRQIGLAFFEITISATHLLLGVAGLIGVVAGVVAFRQMDDKPGVPVLADLLGSLRGRPLTVTGPHLHHGLFVVFEGGEGAGKSTQVDRLTEALRAQGRNVVVTREPGATEVGRRIRSLLLEESDTSQPDGGDQTRSPRPGDAGRSGKPSITPRAEALLYAADRADHVASVVRPALARGDVVISDRYVDSSLAYQGAGRVLPVDEISWLSKWATGGLKPDLVVLLDVDPTVGLRRVRGRGAADRLENESVAFHERVRYAFLDLAAADPSRYLVLDGNRPADVIAAAVSRRVAGLLSASPLTGVPEVEEDTAEAGGAADGAEAEAEPVGGKAQGGADGTRGGAGEVDGGAVANATGRIAHPNASDMTATVELVTGDPGDVRTTRASDSPVNSEGSRV